jgi:hypothetical protein
VGPGSLHDLVDHSCPASLAWTAHLLRLLLLLCGGHGKDGSLYYSSLVEAHSRGLVTKRCYLGRKLAMQTYCLMADN